MSLTYESNYQVTDPNPPVDKSIIPAPLVTINKQYITSGDGTPISLSYDITLEGTLLPNRGSPDSTGDTSTDSNEVFSTDAEKWESINKKQRHLRGIFGYHGGRLSWIPPNGTEVYCFPTIKGINFPPGTWVDRCPYSITMSANTLFGPGGVLEDLSLEGFKDYNLSSCSDSFTVQEKRDGLNISYEVSRTVSATARVEYGDEFSGTDEHAVNRPWENARKWVLFQLDGITSTVPTTNSLRYVLTDGAFGDIESWIIRDRSRSEQVSVKDGSYSITETYTIVDSNSVTYLDTWQVSHESDSLSGRTPSGGFGIPGDSDSHALGFYNTFKISGTIKGLTTENDLSVVSDAYTNALAAFNSLLSPGGSYELSTFVSRIRTAIGNNNINIDPDPIGSSIVRDQVNGTIVYNLTFENPEFAVSNATIGKSVRRWTFSVSQEGGGNAFNTTVQAGGSSSRSLLTTLAIIPIPGRARGPIIQNMNTRPVITRTVTGTLYLRRRHADLATTGANNNRWTWADVENTSGTAGLRRIFMDQMINVNLNLDPKGSGAGYSDSFITSFNENLNSKAGTYTATVVYTLIPTTA